MASQKIVRKIISTNAAPKPVGPYNQAVVVGNTVYLSGVVGLNAQDMKLVEGGIVAQTKQALTHMGHILQAAGSSYDQVIKTTIFLKNLDDFTNVNEVYKEFFKTNYPARSTFEVSKLPLGALIEIEGIAITGTMETSEKVVI